MMASSSRKRPRGNRRRATIALGLLGLLGVATIVVWRRSRSNAEAKIVRELTIEKRTLQSLRTSLERDIRDATSRARIVPAAEKRLGMHVATELEVRNLPATPAVRDSSQ